MATSFENALASMPPTEKASSAIANIYAAYNAGKMSPEQSAAFEGDVASGKLLLPEGAKLKTETAAPTLDTDAAANIYNAYASGKMDAKQKEAYEGDVRAGRMPLPEGAQLKAQPGILEQVGNLPAAIKESVTGANRRTAETDAAPDWAGMPELNSMSFASFKTALGTMFSNPEETAQVIMANAPGVTKRVDDKGNIFLTSPENGQEYAIKPGFQPSDIPRAVGAVAAYTPAGRAATIGGAALKSGLTQAAIEGTQAATGGEFNAGEVLTAGALGGAIPAAGRAISAATNAAKPVVQRVLGTAQRGTPETVAGEQAAAQTAKPTIVTTPEVAPPAPVTPPMTGEKLTDTTRTAALGGLGSKKATQELAAQVAPDQEILAAAKRIGVEEHLQPGHVTTNQAFRQLDQLVKSQTGSELAVAQRESLLKVAEAADDVITKIGGSTDVSTLSSTVKTQLEKSHAALKEQAKGLYDQVDAAIKRPTPIEAPNLIAAITKNADDVGGLKNLSAAEAKLLNQLSPEAKPTYGLLDKLRKDIGEAKRGKQGVFSDTNTAALESLETALRADQKAAAEAAGVGNTWELAQQTAKAYKGLQDDTKAIFGNELDKSLAPTLKTAVQQLPSGNTANFVKLIKLVPEEMRQEVTATGLAHFFQRTARGGEMDFAGYAKWFDGLERNKQAHAALMANLPSSARQQLKDLATISRGIAASKAEFISTGKAINPKALEAADSLIGKVYDEVRRRGVAGLLAEGVGSASGAPGLSTALQTAMSRGKPTIMQATDALLRSPEFVALAKQTVNPNPVATKAAARKVAYSKEFTKFVRALGNPKEMSNREQWILRAMEAENSQKPPKGK